MDAGGDGTSELAAPLCALQYAASRIERCPGARCPFWVEAPNDVRGCAVALAELDLDRSPELVEALLKLRRVLDGHDLEAESRSLFYLLGRERPVRHGR